MKRKPTLIMLLLGLLGVVVGVTAREPLLEYFQGQPPALAPPEVILPPLPEEVAKPHLSWADRECERLIEEHVKAVDGFFADSKKNTRSFAESALGWRSKWKLIVDHVPFTRGGRHQAFIRDKFGEYVFTPQQLEEAVKQVVGSYLKHIESVEGKMLVRIRADVSDFPVTYLIAQIDESGLRASYDQAIARAIDAAGSDLRAGVATELVSIISGEVLAQVAIRLGVSAGVLGAGAASSWATFGIGVIVAIIVDQVVSWVWDWYADPKGELTTELNHRLDELDRLIVDGSNGVTGLRERLMQFARERSLIRSKAVLSILQPQ